jgi:hypothetical protein
MRRIALLLVVFCLPAAASAAAAQPRWLGGKPFRLTADRNAKKPNVAVDPAGTGHFAWDVANPSGADPLWYCRVPRGVRGCQVLIEFALPLESFGEPQVLIVGHGVVVIAHRCCGPGEGTYAMASADGISFGDPRLIGDVEPGQAAVWPGTDVVALTDHSVTAGVSFQAASLSGPPATTSAHVGDGVSQDYDGTIGFPTATAPPLVAFDDLHHGFWRAWSGSGDVNDVASWGPTQPLGKLTELRMATGPAGVVLMGKRQFSHPFADQYVARRFDAATGAWKPSIALSNTAVEDDVIFRDVFEDPGGHVEAVWVANGTHGGRTDPIRLRVSADGGVTWRSERTLVRATNDNGYNLQIGAAADGGGFLTYDRNDAGPLSAVPIPKLSAQH